VTSKTPIEHIQIRVFAHATEDPEKVLNAVRNTLPKELSTGMTFQKTSLTGHHGNPITLFETKLTDKQELLTVLEKIANALTALDKETLSSEVKLHLEKRSLYLRFNKQSAFMGELRFSPNDPIRFKINFKNSTPEEIMEICRKTGLLP